MNDTDILKELFRPDVFVPPSANKVELTEPLHPEDSVSIHGLPDDAVCIKSDVLDLRKLLGNTSKGECKRADYIIISETKKHVLFIELKKSKAPWKDVCQQLHGSYCLARYCQEIGKTFWQSIDFMRNYDHHYISISHTVIGKGWQKETIENSTIDKKVKIKKISHPHHLQYRKLVSK